MPSSTATDPRDKLAYRLTPELALQFGKLVGYERRTVVISTDRNPSSMMLKQAVIAGVISTGGTVHVLNDVPAPSVPFCGIPYNYHINIATINPESLSGMEIFNNKGAYLSAMDVFNMTYREIGMKFPEYNALGSVRYDGEEAKTTHVETLMAKTQDCNCQVVMDGTYYRPAKMTAKLLENLNTDVIIEKRPSSKYLPSLASTELVDLSKLQQSYKGSIGIALNSDGTRVAAIDNKGRYITGSQIALIFTKTMNLKKVTVPIGMTCAIDETMDANGGVVVRASHSFRSAVDAGIANGSDMIMDDRGHFIFPDTSYMADGIHAAAKLAEINGKIKLCDYIDDMVPYFTQHFSIRTQVNKNDLRANIHKTVEEEGYDFIDTGSTRISFDDGAILINLEEGDDSVSIKCEGKDKAYTVSLMDIAKKLVSDCIKKCNR